MSWVLWWHCELCGNDDGGERSRVAACPSSPTVRAVSRCEVVKSELRVSGRTGWQRCHFFCSGLADSVGARCASFSGEALRRSRSCLFLDTLGRLFGICRHGFLRRLRRRLRRWSSKVKSKSLARGGVTTMTLGDDLDDVFLLAGVCVSCG